MEKIQYKSDKLITNLLCIYFIIIFFYGVIIKITFNNPFLFEIKTIFPELILCLVCILCLLRKKRYSLIGFITILYFFIILIINLSTSYSQQSFMMTVRDVYIPILVAFLLSSISMSKESYYDFLRKMAKISALAIIIGFILGIIQYSNGWRWTSSWYTGYQFWGVDQNSSLYIMQSNGRVRVPSIVGNNVKFGMYTIFQLFIILSMHNVNLKNKSNKRFSIFTIILMILAIINIFISNNKTTLLILFMIVYLYFFKKIKKQSKAIITAILLIFGILIFCYLYIKTDFFLSFFDRFSKWSIIFNLGITYNLFFPISTFNFAGNSVTDYTVLNYWDNTYLYLVYSYGIFGLLILFLWCKELYKRAKQNDIDAKNNQLIKYLTVFTGIAAFTTSLVLGRAFFNIFMIVVAFISNKQKG